jgi:hypothetical protein
VSLVGPSAPPNFQEIMAAENQRLLVEDAKRRKRNRKLAEMVPPATRTFLTFRRGITG